MCSMGRAGVAASGCLLVSLFSTSMVSAASVAHWAFDGDLRDRAGSHDGTFAGGRVPAYAPDRNGAAASAIRLDGRDDHVVIAPARGLPIHLEPRYSIAFWARAEPQRSAAVWSEASSRSTLPLFQIGPNARGTDGAVEVTIRNADGVSWLTAARGRRVAFDGEWHHVAWVDDGRSGAIWVDGELDTRFPYERVPPRRPATWDALAAGGIARATPCCFFSGDLDDLRLYDHALGSAEIADLARAEPPAPSLRLVADPTAFGSVLVGDSADLSVTIENLGPSAVELTGLELEPAESEELALVGESPVGEVLAPASPLGGGGGTAVFTLRYSPEKVGADEFLARVEASGVFAGELSLSGAGAAPPIAELLTPGPREVETALAEGQARFRWANPLPYASIEVRDGGGRVLAELPGDATEVLLPTGGADRVEVSLVGKLAAGRASRPSRAIAKRHECARPDPLNSPGIRGPLEYHLKGGPLAKDILPADACETGIGGGAAGVDLIDPTLLPTINGYLQPEGSTGYVIPEAAANDQAPPLGLRPYHNKVTTGFVLQEPSRLLQIDGFYEKIATAFGLELRGRITLVHALDAGVSPGFTAEFSFPDILISGGPLACEEIPPGGGGGAGLEPITGAFELLLGDGKQWNGAVVFRADRDPTDPDAQACLDGGGDVLEFPAGEYLLDIYTVEGDRAIPYYVFVDDLRKEELLIPGVPCPPYPLVKVTDLTGIRTLPLITEVVATPSLINFDPLNPAAVTATVVWKALGKWFDEEGKPHSIDPASDTYIPTPDFEYTWRFLDWSPPITVTSGSSNTLERYVDYGCYRVEITVRDKACGLSKTRSFEVPVVPETDCPAQPYDFLFPTPDPGGIWAVAGLNTEPPPGQGRFQGVRKVEFRVLVVPRCEGRLGTCPDLCAAANLGETACPEDDTVQFRLATQAGDPLDATVIVQDLCRNQTEGAKFFTVTVDDLGAIPEVPGAGEGSFVPVHFQGKAVRYGDGTPVPGAGDPDAGWIDIGSPLQFGNYPESLDRAIWLGHFDPATASYHFSARSSEQTEQRFEPGPSESIDILGVTEIPSKENDVGSGFVARFRMQNGNWEPETGTGTSSGEVLSNGVDSGPVDVSPGQSGGNGGGGDLGDLTYDWCRHQDILRNEFRETLFESILYTGSIGPVPVTIWASIGLGLGYAVEAQVSTFVRPFAVLQGNPVVENHFYLLSKVALEIPAEVRADVLGGIGSVSVGLVPEASFELDTHVVTEDVQIHPKLFVQALFSLTMFVKGCVDLLITDVCVSVDWPIVENVELIPTVGCCPKPIITCDNPTGGDYPQCQYADQTQSPCAEESPLGIQAGGGGDLTPIGRVLQVTSAPTLTKHPDGTVLGSWVDEDGLGHIYVGDLSSPIPGGPALFGSLRDPSAAFLAGAPNEPASVAVVAYTMSYPWESGIDPWPPADPSIFEGDLSLRNQVSATREIELAVLRPGPQGWEYDGLHRISDPIHDAGARGVDGRAAVAGDLWHGDGWVAWVRYDTPDFLVVDGVTKVRKRIGEPGTVCHTPPAPGQRWCWMDVDRVRPQMELSSIWARPVDATGPSGPRVRISGENPGIDIEPAITFSPSGDVACCVWVHDPTHVDLLEQNTGRTLLVSFWDRAGGVWSPPRDVWEATVDPDDTPGILQPSIGLTGDADGILAFTALEGSAPERDTGLGSGRMVYISRLVGGVFQPPELIHQKCDRVQYGQWVEVLAHVPDLVDQRPWKLRLPEVLLTWQGSDFFGLPGASGDVMVAPLDRVDGAPMGRARTLTPDENIHTNVVAALGGGALTTLNLDQGSAILQVGQGAGAAARAGQYRSTSTPLEPDLAVTDCRLREPFAAPGSRVAAHVVVENLGLAGSALTAGGQSAVSLRALYVAEDGSQRVVDRRPLQEISPGGRAEVDLVLEMPLDPVRLRIVLDPNPVDADPTNDTRDCFFGAPPPENVTCERKPRPGGDTLNALTWTNPVLYDEVLVYREGSLVAALPGRTTFYSDPVGPVAGEVLYELRGRVGASKSARTACRLGGAVAEAFLRGDSNADGKLDISDAISTLSFLFLGGAAPPCREAAEANGDGALDLSDPVFSLNYLFIGGRAPPAPFPACGPDPDPPGLGCLEPPACRR